MTARAIAFSAALLLAVAVVLVVTCRAVGVLLMTAGGITTIALGLHALPILTSSHDPAQVFVTMTVLTAFPPGIIGALASAIVFARPIARFLRAR